MSNNVTPKGSVTDIEGFLGMGMQLFPQERFDSLVQSLSSGSPARSGGI